MKIFLHNNIGVAPVSYGNVFYGLILFCLELLSEVPTSANWIPTTKTATIHLLYRNEDQELHKEVCTTLHNVILGRYR
jgi:hypothetical protein